MYLTPFRTPRFPGLDGFIRFYLACSTYNSIVIVYDTNTTAMATDFAHSIAQTYRCSWIAISVERWLQPDTHFQHEAQYILDDPEAMLVWLMANADNVTAKVQHLRRQLPSNIRCDNLIMVAGETPDHEIARMLRLAELDQIVNIGFIQRIETDEAEVLKLNYEHSTSTYFAPENRCVQKMFGDKTRDWHDDNLLLFMIFEPPNVINLTRTIQPTHFFQLPRVEFNIGGTYAYMASLIDGRFNTTSRMFAVKKSAQYWQRPDLAKFLGHFIEKAYHEPADDRQPRWLRYDLLDAADFPAYVGNRTVVSFESKIGLPKGTFPLYPHDLERYILVVPNRIRRSAAWWSAVVNFPMFRVWLGAIGGLTLVRVLLRRVRGQRDRSFVHLLMEICGVMFGTSAYSDKWRGRPERVLMLLVSVAALLSSMLCSGLLFSKFATLTAEPEIDSLAELGQHRYLDVWMPEEFAEETELWLAEQ